MGLKLMIRMACGEGLLRPRYLQGEGVGERGIRKCKNGIQLRVRKYQGLLNICYMTSQILLLTTERTYSKIVYSFYRTTFSHMPKDSA